MEIIQLDGNYENFAVMDDGRVILIPFSSGVFIEALTKFLIQDSPLPVKLKCQISIIKTISEIVPVIVLERNSDPANS